MGIMEAVAIALLRLILMRRCSRCGLEPVALDHPAINKVDRTAYLSFFARLQNDDRTDTDDLKNNALLNDQQLPGVTIVNVTSCAIDAVSALYAHGARNFIFQNAAPLYLSPLFATDARNGVGVPNVRLVNQKGFRFFCWGFLITHTLADNPCSTISKQKTLS